MTESTKPVRRKIRARVPHGVKPCLVVTLYPAGVLGLRELGRPANTEQKLHVGELYVAAVKESVKKDAALIAKLHRAGIPLRDARRQVRGSRAKPHCQDHGITVPRE